MFILNWVFVLDTKSEKNAKIVMNRIFKIFAIEPLHCEYQHYSKVDFDGYRVSVDFSHIMNDWNEFVLTVIQLGFSLGSSWAISGNMFEQVTAILSKNTAHIRFVGLEWALGNLSKAINLKRRNQYVPKNQIRNYFNLSIP